MIRGLGGIVAVLGLALVGGGFWLTTGLLQARITEAAATLAETRAEAAVLTNRIAEFQAADTGAVLPADLTLPGITVAETTVALQEQLVMLARAQGVTLTTLNTGTAPDGLTLPAAALTVEGEGALPDVMAFLDTLERQAPRLGLSQLILSAQDATGQDATGRISLRLTAWGILGGEAG